MKTMTKLAIAVALGLGLTAVANAATEGVDYTVVSMPIKQVQNEKDKVEVLEFFAYWCPHCYDLDPIILKHSKTFAADTYLRSEHVVWDPNRDVGFARLTAAVNQSGLKYQANPEIFDAVVKNRINLGDAEILNQWANSQTAFDGKKLMEAFNGFSAQTQAKQMADWTAEYNIEGTPTVFVGGKYKVEFKNGFEAGMKTIDELVQKVREERGMKAPAPKAAAKPVSSKGFSLIKQANK
ncbi:thiol:disulfide interchange protein DsbA/DsbL [Neisseriaceae bacterium B1]